jgi:glycerol uptake facilitator-like aquaporin
VTRPTLVRRVVAELLGTALLVAAVVGSGIMGERLSDGNVALALFTNTVATGAALIAFILAFGPVSGAHFNPVVSACDAWIGGLSPSDAGCYVVAQVVGGIVGVMSAHGMFGEPWVALSPHARHGPAQLFAESVATFGLLAVIWGVSRSQPKAAAFAVGAYITSAYWFTSSTSFANPAVTVARALTATFSGIRPMDAPGFVMAQFVGGVGATALFRWLIPMLPAVADCVVQSETFQQTDHPLNIR